MSTIGASGVVFGYATYLFARGFFDRSLLELLTGLIVGAVWGAALIASLVPHAGLSWQGHLSGAVARRDRGVRAPARAAGGRAAPARHATRPSARSPSSLRAPECASSPASSRPVASTSATTSARSPSTSRGRIAARRSTASSTCTRSPSPYEPAALRESVYDTAATLLAAGLDPERCIFFRQGDVHEHTELCWLLSSVTAFGDLNRMTQFKEKSGAQRDLVSAGLFFYPVLQAADVLAYRANEVPVGEDQRQHVELMRDVAERFNARFGETLVVPEVRVPEVGARIMDLQHPDRKMSTTGGSPQGTVYVIDEPDAIVKKIRSRGHRLGQRGRPRARQGRASRT